jgi:hypothetical protein
MEFPEPWAGPFDGPGHFPKVSSNVPLGWGGRGAPAWFGQAGQHRHIECVPPEGESAVDAGELEQVGRRVYRWPCRKDCRTTWP